MLILATAFLLALVTTGEAAPEAEVRAIAGEFWIPDTYVPITADRSDMPGARALRAEIAGLLDSGLTAREVRETIINRYGEDLLAVPPFAGLGAAVWLVPAAALVLGAAFVARLLRIWVMNYRRRKAGDTGVDSEVYRK